MSNTDRFSMLERWADGMERLEQYYEGIYGPPATPPSLPPITTRDAMLEAIADGMERAKRNINKKSPTYHSDSVAYVKTVPAGNVHYASLEQIGGKTLVWNQLLNAGTISIATTNTAEKAVGTFSGVSSHKYLFLWNQDATLTSNTRNTMLVRDSQNVAIYESSSTNHNLSAGQYGWLISPTTLTSGTWNINYWGHSPNVAYNITNVMCFDLTLMFGAGNEPTTVAEFQQTFPAVWYAYNPGSLLSAGVTSVISKDSNDTTLQTVSIPAEIRNLEGYGWSAGNKYVSAYNYIDYERKVFVQRLGKVTLTSADVPSADSGYIESGVLSSGLYSGHSYTNIRNLKYSMGGTFADRKAGGYCAVVPFASDVSVNNTDMFASQYRTYFIDVASRDELLAKIGAGVDMYYELETPIETDISAYLTDDNLIEVEAGGTLTFPNANGDDYRIPVPSSETFIVGEP